jgi:hypothetical protein
MASLCHTTHGVDRLAPSISVTGVTTFRVRVTGAICHGFCTQNVSLRVTGVTGRDSALRTKLASNFKAVTGRDRRDRALDGCRAWAPGMMVRVTVTGCAPPYRGATAVTLTDLPQPHGHTHTYRRQGNV